MIVVKDFVPNTKDLLRPDGIAGLVRLLEQMGCAVVDTSRCEGTDIYSIQIICAVHRMAERWTELCENRI